MTSSASSSAPAPPIASLSHHGDVAAITLDDGKVNALSLEASRQILAQLDETENASKAVLLQGRPGILSAGFDLKVMRSDDTDAKREMIAAGIDLFLRLFTYPQPVVVACPGHAMAAGAIVLMSSDLRIGAEGDFQIGLNEIAIGMVLPEFLLELANERLSRRHFTQATLLSRLYSPAEATQAGFLDDTAPADKLADIALERATALAETLDSKAFGISRGIARGPAAQRITDVLSDDIGALLR